MTYAWDGHLLRRLDAETGGVGKDDWTDIVVRASSNDISAKRDMDMNSWPPLLPELGMSLEVRFLPRDPDDILVASAAHILFGCARNHKSVAPKQPSFSNRL